MNSLLLKVLMMNSTRLRRVVEVKEGEYKSIDLMTPERILVRAKCRMLFQGLLVKRRGLDSTMQVAIS